MRQWSRRAAAWMPAHSLPWPRASWVWGAAAQAETVACAGNVTGWTMRSRDRAAGKATDFPGTFAPSVTQTMEQAVERFKAFNKSTTCIRCTVEGPQ